MKDTRSGIPVGILRQVAQKARRSSLGRPLIRLPARSYAQLKEMSKKSGRPMSDVVAAAIEHFRRERILAEADKAYRAAPDHLDELALWDRTLLDGLPKD